tara:strand:- start:611 stop:2455 length:1845 start_codon:yes stop_codon:yes gene_type:complete
MVDVTQIFEFKEDKNLAYRNVSRSINDLISEMNEHGLEVSAIDTSGEVVRVNVKGTTKSRPDKFGEKSGWYFFYDNGNGNFFCNYGNWRTNESYKFSSISMEKLTPVEQANLKQELDKRYKEREKRRQELHDEVAKDCEARFKKAIDCKSHKYLEKKKVKNYGFKQIGDKLSIPAYSSKNLDYKIRSIQYIDAKSNKRFVSGSQVKGNFYNLNFTLDELPNLKKIVVCEGVASACSVAEATNLPTIVVFSASFGLDCLINLRKHTNAQFLIAFDNDTHLVGQTQADKIKSSIQNTELKIPNQTGLDFNDVHQEFGLEEVKSQILVEGFDLKKISLRYLDNSPPEREWLVENLIESGKTGLICSIGGIGKSYIALSLALSVARGHGTFLGKPINKHGNVVMLSAEDDLAETHRRISAIDVNNDRAKALYDVFVLPIPELDKPLTLIKQDAINGLHITQDAYDLIDSLEAVKDLELLVVDPIQSFCSAPTNDNEVGQLWSSLMQMIASKFNTCVASIHHMSKQGLIATNDPLQSRMAVRGASSFVDASRWVLSLFLCEEEEAQAICLREGISYDRMKVVRSAVVKANSDADMTVKTLIRKNGFLELLDENKEINWT